MKRWPLILIGLAVLVLASWWFWSLGNLPVEAAQNVTLQVVKGTVSIQHAADTNADWVEGQTGEALTVGDRVRTRASSEAVINLFGKAESRLAENSELQIDAAIAETDQQPLSLNLHLIGGRMWSHVLRLLDLDSTVIVRVNNVVATVRGTAFDVDAQVAGPGSLVSDTRLEK